MGNPLDTATAILDDTTITVDARTGTVDPALVAYYSFDNELRGRFRQQPPPHGRRRAPRPSRRRRASMSSVGGRSTSTAASAMQEYPQSLFPDHLHVRRPVVGLVLGPPPGGLGQSAGHGAGRHREHHGFHLGTGQSDPGARACGSATPISINADFGSYPDDGQFHHWVVISDGAGTISAYRDNVPQTDVRSAARSTSPRSGMPTTAPPSR